MLFRVQKYYFFPKPQSSCERLQKDATKHGTLHWRIWAKRHNYCPTRVMQLRDKCPAIFRHVPRNRGTRGAQQKAGFKIFPSALQKSPHRATKNAPPACAGGAPRNIELSYRLPKLLVECADAHAVPIGLLEHVAYALTLSVDAACADAVLLNEDVLNSLSTVL